MIIIIFSSKLEKKKNASKNKEEIYKFYPTELLKLNR